MFDSSSGDVGPVGAPRREHVAAALDVEHVGVAGDDPVAVGVAVHGRLAAGPGEELVHPIEVRPPGRIEQVGRRGVGGAHRRRTVPGPGASAPTASRIITRPMPTMRVTAMLRVRQATAAARIPA